MEHNSPPASPLQEYRLQQEALGRRGLSALSAHVLLHVAGQVLQRVRSHIVVPLSPEAQQPRTAIHSPQTSCIATLWAIMEGLGHKQEESRGRA